MKIASSGAVNLNITQSSIGSADPNLDVDYAAWGPFASPQNGCTAIGNGLQPGLNGLPGSQTTGCSYSANSTEYLNIPNAIAGQYYVILVTNFSNQPGYINISQINVNDVGAGSIDCSGIKLNAFIDTNNNGYQDSGEVNFPLGQFHYTLNNGTTHNIIAPTGIYHIFDDNTLNNYDLSYNINTDYSTDYSVSATYSNIQVASSGMTTYNFPVTLLQNYNDISVSLVPVSAPRAGTTYKNKIVLSNNGNQLISTGTLTFNCNTASTITNVSLAGTMPISNGFSYSFTDLQPFETREMIVTISVPPIPNVQINQLLTNTVAVTPPTADLIASNDSSSSSQAVIAAYDPNDKTEAHGEKILFSSFTPDNYLQYTIRFENNGNAGALNVRITDELDSKIDETSIKMVSSSHPYTLDRIGNILNWNFPNIQLPVSIPNTDTGKGFITFQLKLKPGFALGDIIPNAASIYFDTNPAIVTNTFSTEFVNQLNVSDFRDSNIVMYPNPANNSVQISLKNSNEALDSIRIYDVLGKTILNVPSISNNQVNIDLTSIDRGVYFVEITSESQLKLIKKLIMN